MVPTYRLQRNKSDCPELLGQAADAGHYETFVNQTTRIEREDGSLLCVLLKNGLPLAEGGGLYRAVRERLPEVLDAPAQRPHIEEYGIGCMEPLSVEGEYRVTKFASRYPRALKTTNAALSLLDRFLRENVPEAWEAQHLAAERRAPVRPTLPNTTFTTVSVHRNGTRPYAKDTAALNGGYNVLTVFRGGKYDGGLIVFPEYRVGLNVESLDVLIYDAAETYGETPIKPLKESWERISCIAAYRTPAQK